MLVFATPNNYNYRSHFAEQRAWALQQQQLRDQCRPNALYFQQYPSQQRRIPNCALELDDYLYTRKPYYGYTTNNPAELEYELALSRAARKVAIQQLHRDYNAAIRGWYAASQAQRREQEREHRLRARCGALEANRLLAEYLTWGMPLDTELPTQASASTSKAPVENKLRLQDSVGGRMSELQSIFDQLSEGTFPVERVPVAPSQVPANQEATTSSQEGKGKAKEIADSDEKRCLEERLMEQFQSDLSNTFQSILTGLSEGTSTDTSIERVPVTFNAPTSRQVNVDEEGTTSHKGKGKAKEIADSDGEEECSASPAQVEASLSQITSIASRLEKLVADFQFPAELDFSPSRSPSPAYSALDTDDVFALTYTATNAPLRAQEHALSLLLGDLDNVPSFGSHVVRDARRAVVARVGEALEELEKGVEERRGRVRARKADPVSVSVPVEQSSEPENVTSADVEPIKVQEVPSEVFVPVEALEPAASLPIGEAIVVDSDATIEAPAASIEIATGPVAEPRVASLPVTSSEVSETLTAQEVSVPEEEESEEPLVVSVSEDGPSEDRENIEVINHADLVQASFPDTCDSHSQNTLGVFVPDSETLSHADADIPAEVVDKPTSFVPAPAASSFLGSQTPSEDSDPESYSSVDSPAPLSPVSEAEVDTFLLL